MSKFGYEITTDIINDCIMQKITYTSMDNIVKTMSEDVINIKEKQFISALVKLGWTPPNGKTTAKTIRRCIRAACDRIVRCCS